jgi:hypothetical protein
MPRRPVPIMLDGIVATVAQHAARLGLTQGALRERLRRAAQAPVRATERRTARARRRGSV